MSDEGKFEITYYDIFGNKEEHHKPPKKKDKSTLSRRKKPKEGMAFEKRIVKAYNKSSSKRDSGFDAARRRPNSGAIWSLPGDIVTEDALFEAKERGTRTSSGEKTISIHREWLEKIREETIEKTSKQYWFLPFSFKNDKGIYVATDFELQLQIINTLHDLEKIVKEQATYIEQLESQLNLGGDE
ncbi:MAG TPA: hypothetical protein VK190_02760 [Pseudoneobacillus sp.]|nr:hypothetical protein [Pseudoneobacillus sp.]